VIHVWHGWDAKDGHPHRARSFNTWSRAARKSREERRVPIAAVLRDHPDEPLLRLEWTEGLVFGSSSVSPFSPTPLRERANAAWRATAPVTGWLDEHVGPSTLPTDRPGRR
jgi:hypothetical protein